MTSTPDIIWQGNPPTSTNADRIIESLILMILFCFLYVVGTNKFMTTYSVWFFAAVVSALFFVFAIIEPLFTTICIDTNRISVDTGIVSKESFSMELYRVQDVISHQNFLNRIFNVGIITIITSDAIIPKIVLRVPNPCKLRKQINERAIDLRLSRGVQEINFGKI